MATETAEKTRDQVKELKEQGKSPQEIAEALGKTPATVYNHLRNLGFGQGKRGRPRKSDAEKAQNKNGAKSEVKPRPRPGSKSQSTPAVSKANTNGHSNEDAARFPQVRAAVEAELRDARSRVTTLEEMLKTLV